MLPTNVRQVPSTRREHILLLRGLEHLFHGFDIFTRARNEDDSLGR